MTTNRVCLWMLAFVMIGCSLVSAKNKEFEWEPITNADWAVAADSTRKIQDAAMIFEKVIANDRKLEDSKCFRTIYRRIRILSDAGRKWGDVIVPILDADQKIEFIMARTVYPDGTSTELSEDQIFSKEAVKTKNAKIDISTFSIPGVTNDCIVEYAFELQTDRYISQWVVQKDIPLLRAEMRWILAEINISAPLLTYYEDFVTPNYIWKNRYTDTEVENLPNLKHPETLLFKTGYVPPYDSEPYTLPETSIKTTLLNYYGSKTTPAAYWGERATRVLKYWARFGEDNKRLSNVVDSLAALPSDSAKIAAAFSWVQDNITNLSYTSFENIKSGKRKKEKDRESVDDVLKYGYADKFELTEVFYDLLRELNIDAKPAFARDRREALFDPDAKMWQFDNALVLIYDSPEDFKFYFPGLPCGTIDQIPWYLEGVPALVGEFNDNTWNTPFSASNENVINESYKITIAEDGNVSGSVRARLEGHPATELRVMCFDNDSNSVAAILKEQLSESYANSKLALSKYDNIDVRDKPLTLEYDLELSPLQTDLSVMTLQPFLYFSDADNPFSAIERKYPILFKYAYQLREAAEIDLPEGWQVEALPADTTYSNELGKCIVSIKSAGNKLLCTRLFDLDIPFLPQSYYAKVRELFESRSSLSDVSILVRK